MVSGFFDVWKLGEHCNNILQDFQASIVIENSQCATRSCKKCEEFARIQDGGGLFETLKVHAWQIGLVHCQECILNKYFCRLEDLEVVVVFFQKLKRPSRTKDVLLVRERLCIARMVRILFLFQIESFQSLCHQHQGWKSHALTTVNNTSVTEMKDTCPNHFACHTGCTGKKSHFLE